MSSPARNVVTRDRVIIAFLIVVALGIVWTLFERTRRENFELSEKCAAQATSVFARLGYRENGPTGGVFATYESRYNPSTNKCLMAIQSAIYSGGQQAKSKFLFDAFEQRPYAQIDLVTPNGKPSRVVDCTLSPPTDQKRDCGSESEYDTFVASYMK